ncbi:hypothetical protein [Pseudomonas caricapapayae]|uniref:hypothetical protein n=1 Tax=Pseudomonas caricapapayae TaxID=46678 RepID=UPI000F00B8FA|nr:hypothetical protein [Pseudomonas caricapapayae]
MNLKKTAFLAICSCALLGCGPKTKIESGTTITATVWNISETIFAKNLVLSSDERAQASLRAMRCEVAFESPFNQAAQLHEATTATLACDKKDPVKFLVELLGPEGKPGVSEFSVGKSITLKLKESVSI